MRNHTIRITFIVFLLLFLSACSKKTNNFKELSCTPPCWQDLTPGITIKAKLNDFLYNSPIINPGSIFEKGVNRLFQYRIYFALLSGIDGSAYFLDTTLSELFFNGNIDMTFIEAVELYGEPKF